VVLSEPKLAEHREKQLVAPAVPALTGEEPWTYEALEQRFASRATPGGSSPAGGGDFGGGVASLGHELLDIVCAVVRVFPTSRHRSPPGGRPFSSFRRSRWVLVLVCATADAEEARLRPLPLLVAAGHCEFRQERGTDAAIEELFDAPAPGRVYCFRGLRLCNASGRGDKNFFVCTTAFSHVDEGPWNSAVGERTLALWLQHRDSWRAHFQHEASAPPLLGAPAPLASLFVELPELHALCTQTAREADDTAGNQHPRLCDPLLRRPLVALNEVNGIAASLHVRETRQLLVKAFLGQGEAKPAERGVRLQASHASLV